jgi:hypothetical protein
MLFFIFKERETDRKVEREREIKKEEEGETETKRESKFISRFSIVDVQLLLPSKF